MKISTEIPPYQQRVLAEKQELEVKTKELASFFGSEAYKELPAEEKKALKKQCLIMTEYACILDERIARFPK